ncbi:MAG TPA: RNA polymerase subunit sigma-70, partial [Chloroflexota bacterium]
RTPAAARQLASRARRRVKGAELPRPDSDLTRQREAVTAFFRAARGGHFDALVALLDPNVVLRTDFAGRQPAGVVRGAEAVASQARLGARPDAQLHPVLVNGAAGVVITLNGQPYSVMGFIVTDGKIVEIDAIGDPERVQKIPSTLP